MKTRFIPALVVGLALCGAVALTACGRRGSNGAKSAVMACDISFQKVMEEEIKVYEFIYPDKSVLARYLPENEVIDSLLYGHNVRLGVTTRELTGTEKDYLRSQNKDCQSAMIAVDALAVIVNPANPIERITVKDLGKILSGELTDWSLVEPGLDEGKITVVFDHNGSSTINYMRDKVMAGRNFGDNVHQQNGSDKVFEYVAKDKNAIGIIGVTWVSKNLKHPNLTAEEFAKSKEKGETFEMDFKTDVKVLAVAKNEGSFGVKPYQAYIYDGQYPLFRPIYMILTTGLNAPAGKFYTFVNGFEGQKLIMTTGAVSGIVQPNVINVESAASVKTK